MRGMPLRPLSTLLIDAKDLFFGFGVLIQLLLGIVSAGLYNVTFLLIGHTELALFRFLLDCSFAFRREVLSFPNIIAVFPLQRCFSLLKVITHHLDALLGVAFQIVYVVRGGQRTIRL